MTLHGIEKSVQIGGQWLLEIYGNVNVFKSLLADKLSFISQCMWRILAGKVDDAIKSGR